MTRAIVRNVEAGAPAANFEVEFLHASSDRDIAAIFENLAHKPFGALLVNPDEFLFTRYAQHHRVGGAPRNSHDRLWARAR